MNSFQITGYGKPRSDETSDYIIEISQRATVESVIKQILSNSHEWGYIGLVSDEEPFFGKWAFEYKYGLIKVISEETALFWEKVKNCKVIAMKGSGGWTRSDYQLVLEE